MTVRRLLLVVGLIAALLVLSLVAVRWGQPRVVAHLEGDLVAPPAGNGKITAWVEQRGKTTDLLIENGSRPRSISLLEGGGGDHTSTALLSDGLRLAIPTPESASGRAVLTSAATKIGGDARLVCWLANLGAALPAAPFVAAGGPASAILASSEHGSEKPVLVYTILSAGGAELIGVDHDTVYWLERDTRAGEATTTFRRCSLSGGKPEVVAEEPGEQSAVLFRDHLVWTAPSQESSAGAVGAVKSKALPDGRAQVIADWLGAQARVAAGDDALYVLDQEGTWRLGGTRGEQSLIYEGYLGSPMRTVAGAYEYLLEGKTLVKRGLTWGAKLRSALGI